MPLLWLYGAFVTSHNLHVMSGYGWHNVYYAIVTLQIPRKQKRLRRGPPCRGGAANFCAVGFDLATFVVLTKTKPEFSFNKIAPKL